MRTILVTASLLLTGGWQQLNAFCGFYAAQAGANVFNKKSEVIIARDGNRTTLTMRNDFKGDLKQFAMIIPVPVVLKRNDITIKEQSLFDALDKYSAPRIAEYFDENPCEPRLHYLESTSISVRGTRKDGNATFIDGMRTQGVKIEAQYSIDEYEIVILSATESSGLESWLTDNGYSLPDRAKEVLEPYIKDKMKFFAVKVNTEKAKNLNGYLRPIQISFNSPKFMLPIRLGMANSNGEQDLVIYMFSRKGRIEAANYRTVEMPSNRNVPTFLKEAYADFYKHVFEKKYNEEGRKAVFLEYAWNVSPSWSGYHCDPCVGNPPVLTELTQSGVDWVNDQNPTGNVFFTRLHVRYSREKFPEDLTFIETPNVEHFQVRQVIRHAASGTFDCDDGLGYMADLKNRRQLELDEMETLSGWHAQNYPYYVLTGSGKKVEYQGEDQQEQDRGALPIFGDSGGNPPFYMLPLMLLVVVGLLGIPRWLLRSKKL